MSDKGIIFSAPMVRALLDGQKTQTRRLLTQIREYPGFSQFGASNTPGYDWHFRRKDACWVDFKDASLKVRLPFQVGDRLYVREAWRPHYLGDGIWDLDVSYAADGERRTIKDGEFGDKEWNWPKAADKGFVPSIHMPRWASRLTLLVTEVRVERVQAITLGDICAEGLAGSIYDFKPVQRGFDAWASLWDSLHTKPGETWADNPWIVAVTFDVNQGNIDA